MWLENFQQHLHEACPVKFLKSSMEMLRHARAVVGPGMERCRVTSPIVEDIEQTHSEAARAA